MIKKALLLSILSISMIGGGAYAQFAPGSAVEGNVSDLETLPETMADLPPRGEVSGNPCPEPKKALGETPDDLARIQEDITRFTLCVQRAQLLERLNELAESNIETIDSALSLTIENGVDVNAMPGIMPNIPMPQLSEGVSRELENDMAMPPMQPALMPSSLWRVRDIQGAGGSMSAQLVGDSGEFLRVKSGDALPDDGGKISSITSTSVRITRGGEKQTLRWVE